MSAHGFNPPIGGSSSLSLILWLPSGLFFTSICFPPGAIYIVPFWSTSPSSASLICCQTVFLLSCATASCDRKKAIRKNKKENRQPGCSGRWKNCSVLCSIIFLVFNAKIDIRGASKIGKRKKKSYPVIYDCYPVKKSTYP